MSAAAAIFLVAIGAILRYAISDSIEGVDLETIGLILMIAGVAGLLIGIAMMLMSSNRERRSERVVEEPGRPAKREEIRERH